MNTPSNLINYPVSKHSVLFWVIVVALSLICHAYVFWWWRHSRFGQENAIAKTSILPISIRFKKPQITPKKPVVRAVESIKETPEPIAKITPKPAPKTIEKAEQKPKVQPQKTVIKKVPKIKAKEIPKPVASKKPDVKPKVIKPVVAPQKQPAVKTQSKQLPKPQAQPVAPAPTSVTKVQKIIPQAQPIISPEKPELSKGVTDNYKSLLISWIRRFKEYPDYMRARGVQGTSVLQFTVNRYGEVTHTAIVASSGHRMLDRSTLRMLQRALPLPPAPKGYTKQQVVITVPVEYVIGGSE